MPALEPGGQGPIGADPAEEGQAVSILDLALVAAIADAPVTTAEEGASPLERRVQPAAPDVGEASDLPAQRGTVEGSPALS